jgi:hypothetical protein
MTNINVELKGPKGSQLSESLLPAAVAGFTRGLFVVYGADEYHAAVASVAGSKCVGLIDEDAIALTNPVRVIELGQAVAQIGATVTPGQLLTNNALGQAIPAGPGQPILAQALSGNPNAGDYITVNVLPPIAIAAGDAATHYVVAGAIPVASGAAGIGSGAALAMTLAAPTALQDGTDLFITAETAHAHTITTPANGINGSKHIVTFAAQGDGVELEALGGVWYVRGLLGGAALT